MSALAVAVALAPGVPAPAPRLIGTQVVLNLYDCETDRLDDIDWVRDTLVGAARAAGATVVETVFHKFAPCGISGVVVIAESHLAIHIWPDDGYAAVDVFTCGNGVLTDVAVTRLVQAFESRRPVHRRFARGENLRAPAPPHSR